MKALYEIELPNPLPFSKIVDKADEWSLMKSEYSIGLEKICRCNDLLYFQFSKDGFLQLGLYDLAQKKQIYCGKRLTDKVGKSVPVFRLIDRVNFGELSLLKLLIMLYQKNRIRTILIYFVIIILIQTIRLSHSIR